MSNSGQGQRELTLYPVGRCVLAVILLRVVMSCCVNTSSLHGSKRRGKIPDSPTHGSEPSCLRQEPRSPPQFMSMASSEKVTWSADVPSSAAGKIIGKAGQNIKDMRARHPSAKIVLDDEKQDGV